MKPTNTGAAIIGRDEMLALRSLFVTAVGIIAISAVGFVLAPTETKSLFNGLRSNIEIGIAPNCTADPVACLNRKKTDLLRVSGRLDQERASLEIESGAAADLVRQNRELLAQNQLYLSQGRKILGSSHAGHRIHFIGIDYPSRDAMREQLQLLFGEGNRLKEELARSETLSTRLAEARRNIIAQRSEVLAALASIPRKIALVRAEKAYATLESDLAGLEEVLSRGRAGGEKADRLMRSTEALREDATHPVDSNTHFETWLHSSAE